MTTYLPLNLRTQRGNLDLKPAKTGAYRFALKGPASRLKRCVTVVTVVKLEIFR